MGFANTKELTKTAKFHIGSSKYCSFLTVALICRALEALTSWAAIVNMHGLEKENLQGENIPVLAKMGRQHSLLLNLVNIWHFLAIFRMGSCQSFCQCSRQHDSELLPA